MIVRAKNDKMKFLSGLRNADGGGYNFDGDSYSGICFFDDKIKSFDGYEELENFQGYLVEREGTFNHNKGQSTPPGVKGLQSFDELFVK
jgi:hypothetical protein